MRHTPSVALVGAMCLLAGLLSTSDSRGDAPAAPKPKYKTQPLILRKRSPGASNLVDAGRARMRTGDCKGALEAFDDALRVTTDPTVVRDRGICNEKLGYPFPAMDDYRAYLTNEPDAADADDIRARLAKLEGNGTPG